MSGKFPLDSRRGIVQCCHENGKPQLLCAEQRVGVDSPHPKGYIVVVSQDDEGPGGLLMRQN